MSKKKEWTPKILYPNACDDPDKGGFAGNYYPFPEYAFPENRKKPDSKEELKTCLCVVLFFIFFILFIGLPLLYSYYY